MVASSSPAAVSWLYYANRLYELPLGVASIAIAAVLAPAIAAARARRRPRRDRGARNRAASRSRSAWRCRPRSPSRVLAEPIAARPVRARRLRRARHRGGRRGAGGDLRRLARARAGEGARRRLLRPRGHPHADACRARRARRRGRSGRSCCFRTTAMSAWRRRSACPAGSAPALLGVDSAAARLASSRPRRRAPAAADRRWRRASWALAIFGLHALLASHVGRTDPLARLDRARRSWSPSGSPSISQASQLLGVARLRDLRRRNAPPADAPLLLHAAARSWHLAAQSTRVAAHGVQGTGVFRRAADRQSASRQLSRRDREIRRAAGAATTASIASSTCTPSRCGRTRPSCRARSAR